MNLGKLIVRELELQSGVYTLQRWMAHYIAEQMVQAESTDSDTQQQAQLNCFKTILALWRERSSLPDGSRPFEKFDSIWDTLQKLDPNNSRSFYNLANADDSPEPDNELVNRWLDITSSIDCAAQSLVEYSLRKSASAALDSDTVTWLQTANGLDNQPDINSILHLILPTDTSDGNKKSEVELETERLEVYKEKLQGLLSRSAGVLKFIDEQLIELEKK